MSLSPQIKPSIEAAILKNSRIISDPEGYDYNQLCMPPTKADTQEAAAASEGAASTQGATNVAVNTTGVSGLAVDNILILGDLLDSTAVAFKPSINNTNIEPFMKIKSFNIRNVNDVVNNKTVKINVILGNRDLNKIKILPLLLFENKTKWWTDGESFEDVCNNLIKAVNNNNNNNPWLIKDLNEENMFAPIWNRNNKNYKTETWQTDNPNNNSVLYRFNRIFGQDPTIGTMSADKILYTIPYELNQLGFLSDEYIKFGEGFDMDSEDTKTKLAAAVLTFYMLVLLPVENESIKTTIVKKKDINLVGLFRKYYTALNTYVCASAHDEDTKKLFLFSHGGISKDFIENSTYTITKKDNNAEISKPPPTEITGGMYKLFSYDKNITFKTSDEIITIIENYNKAVKDKIKNLFTEYDVLLSKNTTTQYYISDTLLYLIIISTPYNNNGYDMTFLSPIMPGISRLRDDKHMVYSSDTTIYNMFGHVPHGFAPVIDKYEATYYSNTSTRQILYLINCDISNSIIGNYDVATMDKSNYSYLKFDDSYKLTLHQNIALKNPNKLHKLTQSGNTNNNTENISLITSDNTKDLFEMQPDIDKLSNPSIKTTINDTISLLGYFKLPTKTTSKPLTEPTSESPTESLTTFILGCTAANYIVKLFRIPIPAKTNTGGSYKYKKRLSNNKTKRYYKNKYNKYNAFKSSKNKKLVKKSKHKNKRANNKTHKL